MHCRQEIEHGEKTIQCPDCGDVQHWHCWKAQDGCGSYECTSAQTTDYAETTGPTLKISSADLADAVPLESSSIPQSYSGPTISIPVGPTLQDERWNRMAIVAFVVALLGIPLFGIVTGLIAVVLGAIALAGKYSFRRRGAGLAFGAILLGVGDFVGWAIVLFQIGGVPDLAVRMEDFEPDPIALESLPAHINRAMKANVLIQVQAGIGGLLGEAIGSGVILQIVDNSALIVTNRHVVEGVLDDGDIPDLPGQNTNLIVKLVGQTPAAGRLVWVASGGIDLALIRVPVESNVPLAAWWKAVPDITVGDRVFAVGNPHGLGWTHTAGDVSQLRRQNFADANIRVIQTSAAINPGNSGGGLYDDQGHLIGINTWTQDKRFAEGLGFAISFQELLPLAPNYLALPESRLNEDD